MGTEDISSSRDQAILKGVDAKLKVQTGDRVGDSAEVRFRKRSCTGSLRPVLCVEQKGWMYGCSALA